MSKSHPGVRVVQAKGYTPGRPDGKPLWIVWHTTEQLTETLTSAEAIANYIANPSDGRRVSYNFAADADSVLQLVECSSSPWAAGSRTANNRGIHYGLVGRASQTRLQWLDPYSRAMLAQVAPIARADQDRYGIPMRRCSVADLRAGRPGHTTHNDCRLAFGGTTHTDPGPNFPWDYLFGLISEADDETAPEGSMAIVFTYKGKTRMGFGPVQGYKTMADPEMYGEWRSAYNDPPCYPDKAPNGFPTQTVEERGLTDADVERLYGRDMDETPPGLVPHTHSGMVTVTVTGNGAGSFTTGPANANE